jgi:aminobenzoyl-glutamate utilization protein B
MLFSGDFDVSWLIPFGAFFCATWPIGVFTHTWQATACTGSGVGMSGMINASKTLAGTAYDLMLDKTLLEKVWSEFKETTKTLVYKFNIAPDYVPRRVR